MKYAYMRGNNKVCIFLLQKSNQNKKTVGIKAHSIYHHTISTITISNNSSSGSSISIMIMIMITVR